MVVTTSEFTVPAQVFGLEHGIQLVSKEDLLNLHAVAYGVSPDLSSLANISGMCPRCGTLVSYTPPGKMKLVCPNHHSFTSPTASIVTANAAKAAKLHNRRFRQLMRQSARRSRTLR
jgi:hypothetical protein